MIKVHPHLRLKLAAEVSHKVSLREVTLRDLTFHNFNPGGNCKVNLETKAVSLAGSGEELSFDFAFQLKLVGDEEKIYLNIEGTYHVTYEFCGEEKPEKEQLDAFGEVNVTFNVWPYLRELIGSISNRTGLVPPLMLPSLHIGVEKG